jgi:putative membrane protein
MWGFGWGFMFLGPLFLILVVIAIYYIFASSSRGACAHNRHHYPSQDYPSQGRAIEVLNERFAKGEITREQFLQMRNTIEGS